jgi:hypothetical protein
MLMVVLGAGASYDSAVEVPAPLGDAEYRPPLTDHLFTNRATFLPIRASFPQIDPVIGRLVNRDGRTVEQVLRELQNEAADNPVRHQQLAAVRFYLQCLLTQIVERWYNSDRPNSCHRATNQIALIDKLWGARFAEPVCLVTFNYDTLIERALNHYGQQTNSPADYIAGDRFKLFKLHGSVNWARRLTEPPDLVRIDQPQAIAKELITRASELRTSDQFVQVDHTTPLSLSGRDPVLPAIAIPVETKSVFECPPDHIEVLKELLPKVTAILTIGWRATEQHFLDLLNKHVLNSVNVAVCGWGRPDAEATHTQLRNRLPIGAMQTFDYGFRETLIGTRLDGFLAGNR